MATVEWRQVLGGLDWDLPPPCRDRCDNPDWTKRAAIALGRGQAQNAPSAHSFRAPFGWPDLYHMAKPRRVAIKARGLAKASGVGRLRAPGIDLSLVEILDDTIRPSFENEAVTIDHRYAISGLVGERGRHYVQGKGLTNGKGPALTAGEGVDPTAGDGPGDLPETGRGPHCETLTRPDYAPFGATTAVREAGGACPGA
jgi:hypothetical protein